MLAVDDDGFPLRGGRAFERVLRGSAADFTSTADRILGQEQADWLIREVSKSKATWKVITNDLTLGVIVPDGPVNQESLANRDAGAAPLGKELEIARVLSAFKRNRVKNVVWRTADVRCCVAHHSPERAAFNDFDPFWEFVAGPTNAGSRVPQGRCLRQRIPAQWRKPVLRPRGPRRGRRLHRQPPQTPTAPCSGARTSGALSARV
jgi:phosphodiesterase/alkaline phosphatase D-like protein